MSPSALSLAHGHPKGRDALPMRYRRAQSGGAEPMAADAPAAASEYVRWVQATLRRALDVPLEINGVMTRFTRYGIRAFQRRCRLPVTGYVGPDTEAALRRVGVGRGRDDGRLEAEFELTGPAGTADKALAPAKATPIDAALRALGKTPVPGLYRFHAPDGRFYTGQSIDLRRRILQNAWCLSHLGQSVRPFKIALHRVPGADRTTLRTLEKSINAHHKQTNNRNRLNTLTELEFLELENI